MYALDTNTLVYFFRGTGEVARHLLAHPPAEIAIPAIVLFELEVGIAKSTNPGQRRIQVDKLVERVRVLPLDAPAAREAARIRAALEIAGTPIGPMDTLIAGTALASSATLVTHNLREFGRVKGLALVDWFETLPAS